MIDRKLEVIKTKESNFTIAVNNKLIHSKYYPIKEAERFVDKLNLKDKKIITIYGLGVGYHVLKALDYIDEDCIVNVFEADTKIYELASNLGLINLINKDNRIKIYIKDVTEKAIEFYKKFSQVIENTEEFIIYKPSLEVLPDEEAEFKQILIDFYNMKSLSECYMEDIKKNEKLNFNLKSNKIKDFFNKYNFNGKPVIIALSGPSLDYAYDDLKKVEGKIKIFAASSALKPLLKHGVTPDAIFMIDPVQELMYEHIEGYEELEIPLCFLNTASHMAVSKYNGDKYVFYNKSDEDGILIEVGYTVSTAIIDIAIKGGASEIILIGQDLAYLDGNSHSTDSVNNTKLENAYECPKVQGVDGNILYTNNGYLSFKRWIEKLIKYNSNVRFINCSKGARILGSDEMSLEEVINSTIKE